MNKILKQIFDFFKNNKIYLFLFIILIFTLIYNFTNYMPYWDEAVYINNGKYLFSGQEISIYEYQRPPLMGLITGLFWYLGLDEILFSKLILILIFMLGLYYLYKTSEHIKPGSGIITTIIFASLPTIMLFNHRLLTSIPGASLSIIGLYFFIKKKYFFSGLLLALAFLFRYTSGLVFLIIGIFILIELLKNRDLKHLKNTIYYGIGFASLVLPFMILNGIFLSFEYSFFKKILLPFINASKMVAANSFDLVTNGFLYYLNFLFFENFLLIFFIIFILMLFTLKTRKQFIKNKILIITFILSILYYIYLSTLVHYEPRYFIVGLPFFVLIAGFTITEIIKKINIKIKPIIEVLLIVFLMFIFILYINLLIDKNQVIEFEKIEKYNTFVYSIDPYYDGLIGISDPVFGIYNENYRLTYLSGPFYAKAIIEENYPLKYVHFDQRSFSCVREDDVYCHEKLNSFYEILEEKYTLIYEDYFQNTDNYIYKLE